MIHAATTKPVQREAWARPRLPTASSGVEELQYHPYGPLVEAVGITGGSHGGTAGQVSRLLYDEARTVGRDLSFRISELISELLAELAAEAPLLLVLDDLQWAERSTLAAAAGILRRFAETPVALVAARRLHPTTAELESFVERVERGGGVALRVAPLEDSAAAALAARVLRATPGPTLSRQIQAASGNPLFVREVVEALRDAGELEVGDGRAETATCELSPSLRFTILRRLSALGEPQLALLSLASLLGTSFSLRDLGLVARHDAVEVAGHLQASLRSGFLVEVPAGLAFRHDVVREALCHEMHHDMRAALHLEAARYLAEAGRPAMHVAAHLAVGRRSR